MPVEVVIKDNEIAIYLDKKRLAAWLAGGKEAPVPWEEGQEERDKEVDKRAEELKADGGVANNEGGIDREGYKNKDGDKKEFPNPVKGDEEDHSHVADRDIGEEPDGINLFDEGPTGQKGTLQDAPGGKDKLKELRDWLKAENFNYKNFCLFLLEMKEVAGFKLNTPLIGTTAKTKEPTLLQVAFRFYSYWKSAQREIAKQYYAFLGAQLDEMGITIKVAEEVLEGKEIDPKNLPKGIEVAV